MRGHLGTNLLAPGGGTEMAAYQNWSEVCNNFKATKKCYRLKLSMCVNAYFCICVFLSFIGTVLKGIICMLIDCFSFSGCQILILWVSWVVKHRCFGLVAGPTYQTKGSVFHDMRMRLDISQIVPLKIIFNAGNNCFANPTFPFPYCDIPWYNTWLMLLF